MSSIEPDDSGCEVDRAEEGCCAFIITCGDCSELFKFGEEIFDQVSGFVQFFVIHPLLFPILLWWNNALNACLCQQIENTLLRIIGLVGQKRLNACKKIGEQGIGPVQIMRLSRCQVKAGRIAQRIA